VAIFVFWVPRQFAIHNSKFIIPNSKLQIPYRLSPIPYPLFSYSIFPITNFLLILLLPTPTHPPTPALFLASLKKGFPLLSLAQQPRGGIDTSSSCIFKSLNTRINTHKRLQKAKYLRRSFLKITAPTINCSSLNNT
jgi:hypothetical protein